MRAHDAHGDREISRGPAAARAHAVWRAQRELALAHAGRATAIVAAGNDQLGRLAAEVAAGQASLGGRVFRVPIDTLGELRRRIEQLDRRARRLGTGAIELSDVAGVGSDGRTFVVLTGRAPVLAGWSLVAIVEHREGQATLRPVSEFAEGLAISKFAAPRCELLGLVDGERSVHQRRVELPAQAHDSLSLPGPDRVNDRAAEFVVGRGPEPRRGVYVDRSYLARGS